MLRKRLGFTLIEILVVIAIMGILSAVVLANLGEGQAQARDAERKADLRNLQSALELYKLKNGRYPAGCNPVGRWSGQQGTTYACSGNNSQYIVGLAPEFITVLPIDPRLNGPESGYVYTTNAEGSVYKIMARMTVESEIIQGFDNEFKSCDVSAQSDPNGFPKLFRCNATEGSGNNKPGHCQDNSPIFQSTYALWGGFANANTPAQVERFTENIVCDIP